MTAQYWLGLAMFCAAAVFTVALGSVLQYRAIAHQQAALSAYGEAMTASLPPPILRRAATDPGS